MEGDNPLTSYYSYGIIIRSPLSEIERLREFIQTLEETKIVCENVSTRNQYLSHVKPKDVINTVSASES